MDSKVETTIKFLTERFGAIQVHSSEDFKKSKDKGWTIRNITSNTDECIDCVNYAKEHGYIVDKADTRLFISKNFNFTYKSAVVQSNKKVEQISSRILVIDNPHNLTPAEFKYVYMRPNFVWLYDTYLTNGKSIIDILKMMPLMKMPQYDKNYTTKYK